MKKTDKPRRRSIAPPSPLNQKNCDGKKSARQLKDIEAATIACTRCPRLREHCEKIAREKKREFRDQEYWGKPVPGFGDPNARLWIVGLAPAAHGANRTGRMFTGDSSGNWLYRALHAVGFASQAASVAREDGMKLNDVYISAAARCAPPDNKPVDEEIANCASYLDEEWECLKNKKVILALGNISFQTVLKLLARHGIDTGRPRPKFAHGRVFEWEGLRVLTSYHPSRQNTNTGRLTQGMWDAIYRRAKELICLSVILWSVEAGARPLCKATQQASDEEHAIVDLFNRVEEEFPRTNKNRYVGMLKIFESENVIPRNGRLHVVGPGHNHMEWVVPLLARPDIRIHVSEPELVKYRNDMIEEAWVLLRRQPLLMTEGRCQPKSPEDFAEEIETRVTVGEHASQTFGAFDLTAWRMVTTDFWTIHGRTQVKKIIDQSGGRAWLSSEQLAPQEISPDWRVQPLVGDFARYLPESDNGEPWRFHGMGSDYMKVFWISKTTSRE